MKRAFIKMKKVFQIINKTKVKLMIILKMIILFWLEDAIRIKKTETMINDSVSMLFAIIINKKMNYSYKIKFLITIWMTEFLLLIKMIIIKMILLKMEQICNLTRLMNLKLLYSRFITTSNCKMISITMMKNIILFRQMTLHL